MGQQGHWDICQCRFLTVRHGKINGGVGRFLSASLPLEMCYTVTCAFSMLYMYSSGVLYIYMCEINYAQEFSGC